MVAKKDKLRPETLDAKARKADPHEFPKMLYRDEGDVLDTHIVNNPVEESEATKEGWRDQP